MQNKNISIFPNRTASSDQVSFLNLPLASTPLVGRDRKIVEICTLLQRPEVRLFTLTGPGGVGKTRLGLAVANAVREVFEDGVCFV
jgi:predicted ribonuclease YlaK